MVAPVVLSGLKIAVSLGCIAQRHARTHLRLDRARRDFSKQICRAQTEIRAGFDVVEQRGAASHTVSPRDKIGKLAIGDRSRRLSEANEQAARVQALQ